MTKHYDTSFYAQAVVAQAAVEPTHYVQGETAHQAGFRDVKVLSPASLKKTYRSFYVALGKRLFDIAFALLLLPVLAPIIAVLCLLVRRDGGAGMFGHARVGKNGQTFKCWKIRTMVEGAEEKLAAYLASNPEAAAEWARDHKLTHDPRITRLGHFLRKTSLDELPQIWNVLLGEMSFVGPRPVVQDELKKYGTAVAFYLNQKPGVTGLWQVSGRNDVTYEERVLFDIQYFRLSSFAYDLKLIWLTVLSVVKATGR